VLEKEREEEVEEVENTEVGDDHILIRIMINICMEDEVHHIKGEILLVDE
tara:strand:+ start:1581 stop:1730 length:150 start_codon:yes stop_codon:yes gene_type:complete